MCCYMRFSFPWSLLRSVYSYRRRHSPCTCNTGCLIRFRNHLWPFDDSRIQMVQSSCKRATVTTPSLTEAQLHPFRLVYCVATSSCQKSFVGEFTRLPTESFRGRFPGRSQERRRLCSGCRASQRTLPNCRATRRQTRGTPARSSTGSMQE